MTYTREQVERRLLIERAGGILSLAGLARRWGMTRQSVWEMAQRPDFPKPIEQDGEAKLWFADEADQWRASRQTITNGGSA
jgi:predicted DNA-binding transcriptional regulator AlpA